MSHPTTLPLAEPLPPRPGTPSRLRIVKEPGRGSFLPWEESRQTLAPLPVPPSREAPTIRLAKEAPIERGLPSLVPLDPGMFAHTKQPWAVRRVTDFLKLFLPELSLTVAGMLGSGVLAARMARWMVSPTEAAWIIAGYGAISLIDLSGLYLSAKDQPYAVNKTKVQRRLLLVAGLFLPHLVAYSLLTALK